MNRFLTIAASLALGLALCGIAKADRSNGFRLDQERLERDPSEHCDQDDLWYFDPWRWQFPRDGLWYFDLWWFDFNPDDLRHFNFGWVSQYWYHYRINVLIGADASTVANCYFLKFGDGEKTPWTPPGKHLSRACKE